MVARSSRAVLVPFTLLEGASCLLPERRRVRLPLPPSAPVGSERLLPAVRPASAATLTAAELRVCELMLEGLANKEIASALDRAEATIKNQVAAVLRKHGVPSRMRLMALYR
jgi:DNA-binding NarL/FixJ family response regulator